MAGLGVAMAKNRKHGPHPGNRKGRVDQTVRRATPKAPSLASSPVTVILENIFGDWGGSRLEELAVRIAAEPFDLSEFRREIRRKLDRPIPRNRADAPRVTFADRLKQTGSLTTIVKTSTLQEVQNCLLIPRIFDEDLELERKRLSPAGLPLRTHRKLYREAKARMREIEEQDHKDANTIDTEEYRQLDRQFRDNIILVILSTRRPGSRRQLLSGQPVSALTRRPRRKMVGAGVAIFWVLRTRLSPKCVSNRFIHQLTALISDPEPGIDDDTLLNEAEALRKAIADDVAGWQTLLDLP